MHVSPAGRAFIGVQEGLRLRAYRDSGGVWTIGYGHTSAAGAPAVSWRMTLSRAEAAEILSHDLLKYEGEVAHEVHVPLSQCQFDALVSFTYNCGQGALRKTAFLARLNAGKYTAVPGILLNFNRAGGQVLGALVRRRKAEAAMFQGRYPSRAELILASMLGAWRGAKEQGVKA